MYIYVMLFIGLVSYNVFVCNLICMLCVNGGKRKGVKRKKKLLIIRHWYDFTLCLGVFTKVQVMMISDPLW